jgi:hypothetical protein
MTRLWRYAIGSGCRPFVSGFGEGPAHLPQPEPHPGVERPNHDFHAARRIYPAASATISPTATS